jgi:uncharacterized membrane protein
MARSETQDLKNLKDKAQSKVEDISAGNGQGGDSLGKKLLVPAAAGLGTLAATYAARKGPELLRDRVKPKLEEEGGEEAAKVGKKAAQKLEGEGGSMGAIAGKLGGGSREKTRRLPIQRWTDIAAPIDVVYRKWTEFDEFPKFMHRVLDVEKEDRNKLSWTEKIWFSTRQWEGEITERRKNDRIAWKTTKGTSHSGLVTFHKLDSSLTRVMIDMDFRPSGMLEKMASGLRFVKRAVEADLARFKAYVELGEARGIEYTQEATTEDSDQAGESQTDGGGEPKEDRDGGRELQEQRRA